MKRSELMPGDKILSPLGRIMTISRNQLYTLPDEFFAHCRGVPIEDLIDKFFEKNSAGYIVKRPSATFHIEKKYCKISWYYDGAEWVPLIYWHDLQHLFRIIDQPLNLLPNER